MKMSGPIVYIDRSEVRPGKLDELKRGIAELAELVEANEPQLRGYHVYFTEDGTEMSVIHVHADSASLELHFKVAGPAFSRFVGLVRMKTIDVFGMPEAALLEQIREKATLLGSGSVTVHEFHAGFTRPATD
jgi:quinol monooxygenase YgiN